MYGPFHRFIDSPDEVRMILESKEIWGMAPRNLFQSDIPKVKAYDGKLPAEARGMRLSRNAARRRPSPASPRGRRTRSVPASGAMAITRKSRCTSCGKRLLIKMDHAKNLVQTIHRADSARTNGAGLGPPRSDAQLEPGGTANRMGLKFEIRTTTSMSWKLLFCGSVAGDSSL